jgi:hypothetical protein
MATTIISSSVKEASCAVSSVQDIQLDRIRESSSNPRRAFDEGKLRELADNIYYTVFCRRFSFGPPLMVQRERMS